MEVRDPLYGLIEYDNTEEKIINSRIFQRLRKIKQLALASYVYPAAHHTRFEHSLGVMHLSGKVATSLNLDDASKKIIRLAGLLHDIGHGPFSHVSENVLEKYVDKGILKKYKADNAHELLSLLLIQQIDEIRDILSDKEIEDIVLLLQANDRRSIEHDIVSGPLDVDKIDYLLRDGYFAGVKYGTFDLEKVFKSFTKIEISREETQLGITNEGIYSVEQLLLAKYHMNVQVYQHRVRRITDAMLVKGIEFAIEEGIEEIINIYKIKDTPEFLSDFISFDDETLIRTILSKSKGWANDYFERIANRKLFKEVFEIEINDKNFDDDIILESFQSLTKTQSTAMSEKIADILNIPPEHVIIDRHSTLNPTYRLYGKIDISNIMVKDLGTKSRYQFPSVSKIFSNSSIEPQKEMLYIYAPIDKIITQETSQEFKINKKQELLGEIKEVLS
ncbi:MAG: HD domain-containing protein [Methanosarcinales archaeon]|nr:HD domain-containing protein [Methanosarcinales archaeon]